MIRLPARPWLVTAALATAALARADEPVPWTKYVTPLFADRVRGELVDWFQPPDGKAPRGAQQYGFFAQQLRAGLKVTVPHLQVVVEGQDVRLQNLPDDASLAAPYGNLGPGALYFAHSPGLERDRTSQGETSLRQGYATVSDVPGVAGLAFTGGRFEYSDGLEFVPADPTLAWLKRFRIGERLVGPFNYTHYGRSFDGGRLVYDRPAFNLTAMASRPTHGGFEMSTNRELGDIGVVGLAATKKGLPPRLPNSDFRLFYFYYDDRRFSDDRKQGPLPVKVDNRPLAVRMADTDSLAIHTIGADALSVFDVGPGRLDALLWGAVQTGAWGVQDHRAWAFAVEAGYQLPKCWAAPWLRVGIDQSSGDGNPEDGDHRTFFQMLPTARIYAQFPFFNMMNTQDTFAQLILKPLQKVTIRTDYHWLRLTERADLWYAGGGATNDDVFGFSGIPANKHRELAHLVDLGVVAGPFWHVTAATYYGHAFGQGVVRETFPGGTNADYGYLELTYRY